MREHVSRRGSARRSSVLLALTFACVATGALAEQAPPPALPSPTATAVSAARTLVVATGISRSFALMIPQFMDQISKTLGEARPGLGEDLDRVMTELKPEFDRQADEMIEIAAQVYAKHIPEADLQAAVAFFTSDPGRKYAAAQRTVLAEVVTAMQGWQGKISTDMMSRVRTELKKKGHEL